MQITETTITLDVNNRAHPAIPAGSSITCIRPEALGRDLRPDDLIVAVSEAIGRAPLDCFVREVVQTEHGLIAIVRDEGADEDALLSDPEPIDRLLVLGIVQTVTRDLEFEAENAA